MKKVCMICGKTFEGRANATVCSGVCRLEAKKLYAKEYKEKYPNKVKKSQKDHYEKVKSEKQIMHQPEEVKPKRKIVYVKDESEADKLRNLCKESKWGRKYKSAFRLDQIAMLSWALDYLGIARMSYGDLSVIYDTPKYDSLLKRVLNRMRRYEDEV